MAISRKLFELLKLYGNQYTGKSSSYGIFNSVDQDAEQNKILLQTIITMASKESEWTDENLLNALSRKATEKMSKNPVFANVIGRIAEDYNSAAEAKPESLELFGLEKTRLNDLEMRQRMLDYIRELETNMNLYGKEIERLANQVAMTSTALEETSRSLSQERMWRENLLPGVLEHVDGLNLLLKEYRASGPADNLDALDVQPTREKSQRATAWVEAKPSSSPSQAVIEPSRLSLPQSAPQPSAKRAPQRQAVESAPQQRPKPAFLSSIVSDNPMARLRKAPQANAKAKAPSTPKAPAAAVKRGEKKSTSVTAKPRAAIRYDESGRPLPPPPPVSATRSEPKGPAPRVRTRVLFHSLSEINGTPRERLASIKSGDDALTSAAKPQPTQTGGVDLTTALRFAIEQHGKKLNPELSQEAESRPSTPTSPL